MNITTNTTQTRVTPPGPPFTLAQLHTGAKIATSVAVLSIFGACMIILSYVLIRRMRNFRNRMLVYLSIADIGGAICYISGAGRVLSPGGLNTDPVACQAQGFLLQVFHNIANCWVIFITLTLYLNCFHTHLQIEQWERWFIGSSILFPLVVAFIGLAAFDYGPAGMWCWFAGKDAFIAQQALWFSIGYSTLLFILFVYGKITFKLIQGTKNFDNLNRNTKKKVRKFAYYPLAYLLIWVSGILRRIVETYTPNSYPFLILQITFVPAQGILNFIGYFLNRRLHYYWYQILRGNRSEISGPKKKKNGSDGTTSTSSEDYLDGESKSVQLSTTSSQQD